MYQHVSIGNVNRVPGGTTIASVWVDQTISER